MLVLVFIQAGVQTDGTGCGKGGFSRPPCSRLRERRIFPPAVQQAAGEGAGALDGGRGLKRGQVVLVPHRIQPRVMQAGVFAQPPDAGFKRLAGVLRLIAVRCKDGHPFSLPQRTPGGAVKLV